MARCGGRGTGIFQEDGVVREGVREALGVDDVPAAHDLAQRRIQGHAAGRGEMLRSWDVGGALNRPSRPATPGRRSAGVVFEKRGPPGGTPCQPPTTSRTGGDCGLGTGQRE